MRVALPWLRPHPAAAAVRPLRVRRPRRYDVVGVFNDSPEAVGLIHEALRRAGFVVTASRDDHTSAGQASTAPLAEPCDMRAIVYDLRQPYAESWRTLQRVRRLPGLRNTRFVITSPHAASLQPLIGDGPRVYEVFGRPRPVRLLMRGIAGMLNGPPHP